MKIGREQIDLFWNKVYCLFVLPFWYSKSISHEQNNSFNRIFHLATQNQFHKKLQKRGLLIYIHWGHFFTLEGHSFLGLFLAALRKSLKIRNSWIPKGEPFKKICFFNSPIQCSSRLKNQIFLLIPKIYISNGFD